MSIEIINNTASNVLITDTGKTVPASGSITVDPNQRFVFARSNDLASLVADNAVSAGPVSNPDNHTLKINDGVNDLAPSDGLDLIKIVFPDPVGIKGGTDETIIGNEGDRLKTTSTSNIEDIDFSNKTLTLFNFVQSTGFLNGESYNNIIYTVDNGFAFLSYRLNGIEQFILRINVTNQTHWEINKNFPTGFLLQENGDKILQEDSDALLAQGLLPT